MSSFSRDQLSVECREDLAMIRSLARKGLLPADKLSELVEKMSAAIDTCQSERVQASLFRALVACQQSCLDALKHAHNVELKLLDKELPDKHEHAISGSLDVRTILDEIEGDERFERLAEEIATEQYARELGGSRIGRQVAVSPSSPGNQSGRNGHDHGTDGKADPSH